MNFLAIQGGHPKWKVKFQYVTVHFPVHFHFSSIVPIWNSSIFQYLIIQIPVHSSTFFLDWIPVENPKHSSQTHPNPSLHHNNQGLINNIWRSQKGRKESWKSELWNAQKWRFLKGWTLHHGWRKFWKS